MTRDAQIFQNYTPCSGNYIVRITDGSFIKVAGIGSVVIS